MCSTFCFQDHTGTVSGQENGSTKKRLVCSLFTCSPSVMSQLRNFFEILTLYVAVILSGREGDARPHPRAQTRDICQCLETF